MTKNKSKPLALLIAAMLFGSMSYAQSVYFKFTDGTSISYLLNDVQKKTITGSEISIWLTDGTIYNWQLNQLDYYNYEPDLITAVREPFQLQPLQLFPNPAQEKISIAFNLYQKEKTLAEISSVEGKLLHTLELVDVKQGQNSIDWNLRTASGQKLSQGTYILRLISSHISISKKFVVSE
jgi:hypothetical protein